MNTTTGNNTSHSSLEEMPKPLLALPEPVESQLARHGIEPWMWERDFAEREKVIRMEGLIECYDRIEKVNLFSSMGGLRTYGGDGWDLLHSIELRVSDANVRTTAKDIFQMVKRDLEQALAMVALRGYRANLTRKQAA